MNTNNNSDPYFNNMQAKIKETIDSMVKQNELSYNTLNNNYIPNSIDNNNG